MKVNGAVKVIGWATGTRGAGRLQGYDPAWPIRWYRPAEPPAPVRVGGWPRSGLARAPGGLAEFGPCGCIGLWHAMPRRSGPDPRAGSASGPGAPRSDSRGGGRPFWRVTCDAQPATRPAGSPGTSSNTPGRCRTGWRATWSSRGGL